MWVGTIRIKKPGWQEPDVTGSQAFSQAIWILFTTTKAAYTLSTRLNFSAPVGEKACTEGRERDGGVGESLNWGNQKTLNCRINSNCKCYFCSPAGGQRQNTAIPQPLSRCWEVPASSHEDQIAGSSLAPAVGIWKSSFLLQSLDRGRIESRVFPRHPA